MGRLVGIDLGTTNSVVAVMDGPQPTILYNREGKAQTRSMVGLRRRRAKGGTEQAEMLTGDAALANWALAQNDTVTSVKRLMGRGLADPEVQLVREWAQYEIVEPSDGTKDGVRVLLNGKEYSPVDISAQILRKLKEDAEYRLGEEVTHAVITVPAYFSHIQKDATRKAGQKAGLKVMRILDEPTAAAIAYGVDAGDAEAKTIVVYDLGGGTFDISVLVMAGGVFAPLNLEGDMWLGGDNFDQRLVEHVVDYVREEFGIDPTTNAKFMVELRKECQRVKETLAASESADIVVAGMLQDGGSLVDVALEITRPEFENLIRPLVDQTVALVEKALANANMSVDQVDHVLMAGNATVTPLVQHAMEGMFGPAKVLRKVHPKHCVAMGAAIVAAVMGAVVCGGPDPDEPTRECGHVNEMDADVCARCGAPLVLDPTLTVPKVSTAPIAPFSYGAQTAGDSFAVFVRKGDPYPTEAPQMHVFRTQVPNARMISIPIYGGDDLESASANQRQGEAFAILPPGLPAGTPIRVRLWLDADGVFKLSTRLEDGTDLEPWVVEKGESQERVIETLEKVEELIGIRAEFSTPQDSEQFEESRERVFEEMRGGRFTEALQEVERLEAAVTGADMELAQKAENVAALADFLVKDFGWAFGEARTGYLENLATRTRTAIQGGDGEALAAVFAELDAETSDLPDVVNLFLALRRVLNTRIQPYDPRAAAELGAELAAVEEALKSEDPGAVERLKDAMVRFEAAFAKVPAPPGGYRCPKCGTTFHGGRYCPACGTDVWLAAGDQTS